MICLVVNLEASMVSDRRGGNCGRRLIGIEDMGAKVTSDLGHPFTDSVRGKNHMGFAKRVKHNLQPTRGQETTSSSNTSAYHLRTHLD